MFGLKRRLCFIIPVCWFFSIKMCGFLCPHWGTPVTHSGWKVFEPKQFSWAVLACDKMFAVTWRRAEQTHLPDQVCGAPCTDGRLDLDTAMFQFKIPLVTFNDFPFFLIPRVITGESRLQGVNKVCPKSLRTTLKAVAMRPRESVPRCDLAGDPVFLTL